MTTLKFSVFGLSAQEGRKVVAKMSATNNKFNFLRLLGYLEQGYSWEEVEEEIYGNSDRMLDVFYNCMKELTEYELTEVIFFLISESLYFAILDIAEIFNIDEEKLYWL